MKPYAVIHYLDNGQERHIDVYSQDELEQIEGHLKRQNAVTWTCLCNRSAVSIKTIPLRPPEKAQERRNGFGMSIYMV